MNNKRQTIWLVSMLSLMVILSAYYLFTEDVTPANQQANNQVEDTTGTAKNNADGFEITEVDGTAGTATGTDGQTSGKDEGAAAATDGKAGTDKEAQGGESGQTDGKQTDGKQSDEATASGDKEDSEHASATDGSAKPEDEAVLQGISNQTGAAYFDEIQLKRMESYSKREEELNGIIADTSKHTQEETSAAVEELSRMDATEQRISSLEEKLLADYDNAVVEEENNTFKVVVQADKLDKTQAVSIVETAMKELNVTPDRVTVQYIANP